MGVYERVRTRSTRFPISLRSSAMARPFILALALAAAAANDSVDVVDGNTNGFDGAPCTAEQTQCDDGACCATANWCCYGVVPPPYKTEMTVNGRTCYEKMQSDQDCGSKDSDAAARTGIALLVLGAALAVAAA